MSNTDTAARGHRAFIDAVEIRGGRAGELQAGKRTEIAVQSADGRRVCAVRVSSKRRGDWQTNLKYADPDAESDTARYWAFVDLGSSPSTFFIAPEYKIQREIAVVHARYLEFHGGSRPWTPSSEHHKISVARVETWRDRWDLLGLPQL